MRYKISVEAQNDLENIWLYTFETWSAEQADRYYNLTLEGITIRLTKFSDLTEMQKMIKF